MNTTINTNEQLAKIIANQMQYERMDESYIENMYDNLAADLAKFAPNREIVYSSNKIFGATRKLGEYFQYFLLNDNKVYIANKYF